MNEQYFETLLRIKTSGEQKDFPLSHHYNRYEPTSYKILTVLKDNFHFTPKDSIVDFGCGKGRLNFYINYYFNCNVVGIEMNNCFFQEALNNQTSYLLRNKKSKGKIHFLNIFAQEYTFAEEDNIFYFFNPFSVQIFIHIIGNLLDSFEEHPRKITLIIYYPSEDYIFYLNSFTPFYLKQEIQISPLFKDDNRERLLIYEFNGYS